MRSRRNAMSKLTVATAIGMNGDQYCTEQR